MSLHRFAEALHASLPPRRVPLATLDGLRLEGAATRTTLSDHRKLGPSLAARGVRILALHLEGAGLHATWHWEWCGDACPDCLTPPGAVLAASVHGSPALVGAWPTPEGWMVSIKLGRALHSFAVPLPGALAAASAPATLS